MKEIEIMITDNLVIDLIKGKKISYVMFGEYRVDIYPPNHGIYLTCEEYSKIKRACLDVVYIDASNIFEEIEKRREKC